MSTTSRVSRLLATVTIVMAMVWSLVVPVSALTPLASTDVAAFASRAEQWAEARAERRAAANEAAAELAVAAREAEEARVAAEAQLAADLERERAAAATSTTTVPPTTAPPTTAPPTTAPPTTSVPTTTVAPAPTTAPPAGTPTAAQWEALRQCESSGNYSITNPDGRFRGAYQFSVATWDWIAGMHRPDLVGVDPAAAAPADQDAMALLLWQRNGWGPWPHCGRIAAAT